MGAIVRKGGFGYPFLVAIFFFMLFYVMMIIGKKLAETFVLTPELGAWLPSLLMVPFGAVVTYRALQDKKLDMAGKVNSFFNSLVNRFKKGKTNK